MRSALEYAVDRAALNKVVFDGLGEPAYQTVPSWSPGYSKSLGSSDAYNPAKAKAMLKAAGYPKGVKFNLIIPAGDATFARAAALLQAELASAGFTANLQQIPGADFLTDVYIKKQGDAVLSEQLSNGPDLTNSFEALFESSGFVANALGAVNPTADAADRAGQRVPEPEPAGPADAADRQDGDSAGSRGPARLHAVDRRLQQEPGRWERGRSDRPVPLEPGRHLHQEVAAVMGCTGDGRTCDVVQLHRISTESSAAHGVQWRFPSDVRRPSAAHHRPAPVPHLPRRLLARPHHPRQPGHRPGRGHARHPAEIAKITAQLHLNEGFFAQYWNWLKAALQREPR